jgi:chromosome segregation ATPase
VEQPAFPKYIALFEIRHWMASLNESQPKPVSFKEILVRVPEELYSKLEEERLKQGFGSISDYLLHLIALFATAREKPTEKELVSEHIEKLRARIERFVQDELNKRLEVVEVLKRRIIELSEKVDSLEQRISKIETQVKASEAKPREAPTPRKTAIERLREEKVLFESSLPPRIQRDRLFAYLERAGAVVIKLSRERVAVDSEFWLNFKEKLFNEVRSNNEEDLRAILGDKGYELWKALYNDNLIIYDTKLKKWKPLRGELP